MSAKSDEPWVPPCIEFIELLLSEDLLRYSVLLAEHLYTDVRSLQSVSSPAEPSSWQRHRGIELMVST